MTRPGTAGQLARALGDGDETGADTLLRKALTDGTFIPSYTHSTLYVPNVTSKQPRGDHRYEMAIPLCVKRHQLPRQQLALLQQIFAWLRAESHDKYVPHWATDHFIVSRYLENTVDLTSVLTPATPDDAAVVRQTCARSLQRFHTRQREFRTRLEAGGTSSLPAFSMTRRWEWARGEYRKITREDPWGHIGDRIARAPERPKDMLFFDPKPANYLIPAPQGQTQRPWAPETAHRIDLDLLVFLAPVALQVAIMLFSHPMPIAGNADTTNSFFEQRRLAHELAKSLGVESTETDDAICYHLTRNWVSAVQGANPAKSAGLLPWLKECLRQIVGAEVPDTVRRLTKTTATGTPGGPV